MSRPAILEHAAQLAEPIRCRLLHVLERHELTVGELCSVLQLPQSTVSRHLKVLGEGGWLAARRDGTSNLYRRDESFDGAAGDLWKLVRREVMETPEMGEDRRRLEAILRERRSRSKEFFASAERWDALRDELFGHRFDLQAALGLLDPGWHVADLGCGTGRLSEALAPFVEQVSAVDGSPAMLDATRARVDGFDNVRVFEADLEDLPLDDHSADAATLVLALHHAPEPLDLLRETRRILRPQGRLLLVDMLPHGHEEYRSEMGHVWLGFSLDQMHELLDDAGFGRVVSTPLRPDPVAKGPGLFAATAWKNLSKNH